MNEISNGNLLRSWKEIAAYLGCDVRTCHRWEAAYGMPVHRAEGAAKKSPVFAYKDELDKWFRETFKNGGGVVRPARIGLWTWVVRIILLAVALLWSYTFVAKILTRGQPANFHIEGSTLIVVDKEGRELWRQDMKVDDLQNEAFYRANFQVVNKESGNLLPVIAIRDINADGHAEVLFALRRVADQTGEGILYCFDRKGREIWRFEAGRELVCRSKTFTPDYRIAGFYLQDIEGDGRLETLVESFQAPDWPCQLALLDASGKKIGEFWNAGYLREMAYGDINGDGRRELVVCGVNNEYKGGCIAVFDPLDMRGGSPQTGGFVCPDIGPGTMLYYVLTPYVDISMPLGFVVEGFDLLDISKNNWTRAQMRNGLIFEFDPSFRCVQVSGGHRFELVHNDLAAAGKITSVLGEAYFDSIRDGVLYWDGKEWTAEPTPVRR